MKQSIVTVPIQRLVADRAEPASQDQDLVAVEEPRFISMAVICSNRCRCG